MQLQKTPDLLKSNIPFLHIAFQRKNLEIQANLSELFLDTADEYFLAGCCHVSFCCCLMDVL